MKETRLKLLPVLLDKYAEKLTIDVDRGTVEGLTARPNGRGYLTINFWHEGTTKYYRVHEVIAYVGGLDLLNKTVDHINGVKTDNRLDNLRTLSSEDNHRMYVKSGAVPKGDSHASTKLSEAQREEIRSRYTGRYGEQSELAREYGVHQSAISRLLKEVAE